MSEAVAMKNPRTMMTSTGWTYQTTVNGADYTFAYEVTVYREGRKIASTFAATKRGARFAAKKLRRRHNRRQRLTGETRVLR